MGAAVEANRGFIGADDPRTAQPGEYGRDLVAEKGVGTLQSVLWQISSAGLCGLSSSVTVSAGQPAMTELKGSHFERDVVLWAIRWYVAYPISYRQLEEIMEEHGVKVDHATLNRWVLKYVPLLDQEFRARKHPVGSSRRMDGTYVRVKGLRHLGRDHGCRHGGMITAMCDRDEINSSFVTP